MEGPGLRVVEPQFVATRTELVGALAGMFKVADVAEAVGDEILRRLDGYATEGRLRHRNALMRISRDLIKLRGAAPEELLRVDDALLAAGEELRRLADDMCGGPGGS